MGISTLVKGPKKVASPIKVPDDLAALSKEVGNEPEGINFIVQEQQRIRSTATINRDGTLRDRDSTNPVGIQALQRFVLDQDEAGLVQALERTRDFQFDTSGKQSSVGGTATLEEALTKPGWQHSGRKVKIVNMSPMQYLQASAKGHGMDLEELLEEISAGSRTDRLLEAIIDGKDVAAPYLDYRNGSFGQEGQHRAMAAAMLGKEKIPVTVLYDESRTPAVTKAGATGAAVLAAEGEEAEASTPATPHPEASQIAVDEGSEDASYLDSRGLLTGGIGHLLTKEEAKKYPKGTKIPEEVRDKWFQEDIKEAQEDVKALLKGPVPSEVEDILVNMAFNLGRDRLKRFKKMWKAIEDEDWKIAADEMVDSDWYNQVGDRSKRLVARMRRVRSY